MTIETRHLGRTGTDVTILGYGAMELRGRPWGPAIEDEEAGRLLNAVLDGGINLIDTSIDYGRSEELIGRYLAHRRGEYFLASKCGCLLGDPPPGATPPSRTTTAQPTSGPVSSRVFAGSARTGSISCRSTCRRPFRHRERYSKPAVEPRPAGSG